MSPGATYTQNLNPARDQGPITPLGTLSVFDSPFHNEFFPDIHSKTSFHHLIFFENLLDRLTGVKS